MEKTSKCNHSSWVPIGYPQNRPFEKQFIFRVISIYNVYCIDCKKFINLLDKEEVDANGQEPIYIT